MEVRFYLLFFQKCIERLKHYPVVSNIVLWKDLYLLYRLSTSLLLVVTSLEVRLFSLYNDRWFKLKVSSSARPCRQCRCLETFPCRHLLQLPYSSNIHGSWSPTRCHSIYSWTPSRSSGSSHQPSKLRCAPFHWKHFCVQKTMERYRNESWQISRLPQDCGWDGWKEFSCYPSVCGD